MTGPPLVTVTPATTVDEALRLLVDSELGALPVVDSAEGRRLLGMVTDLDLLCVETFLNLERGQDVFPRPGESFRTFNELKALSATQLRRTVGEILAAAPPLVTITPDTTIQKADRLLIKTRVPRLPVVDTEGRLLGILPRSQIIRMLLALRGTPVVTEAPDPTAAPAPNLTELRPEDAVARVMAARQVRVTPDTPIEEAFRQMIGRRIRGLVVVDDAGRLVGVASDYDLLQVDPIDNFKSRSGDAFPKASESFDEFHNIQEVFQKQAAVTVGQVMTPNPFAVHASATFADALQAFVEKRVARLPVVDDAGQCVGVLTRARALTALMLMRAPSSTLP